MLYTLHYHNELKVTLIHRTEQRRNSFFYVEIKKIREHFFYHHKQFVSLGCLKKYLYFFETKFVFGDPKARQKKMDLMRDENTVPEKIYENFQKSRMKVD